MKLVALHLRDNKWVVRPEGCLGTMGWKDGVPWTAIFVTARSESQALAKAGAKTR